MRRGAARAWSASSAILIAVGIFSSEAEAEPPADRSGLSLAWEAPEVCPTRAQILEEIDRVAGAAPANQNRYPLDARARVERVDGTWRAAATLVTRGESSSRHVEGQSCREVSDALVLIIALAINPDAAVLSPAAAASPVSAVQAPVPVPSPPEPLPPSIPSPPPEIVRPPSSTARVEERPGLRPAWAVEAAFVLDQASLPSLAAGGELGLSMRISRVELGVQAALLGSGSAYVADSTTQGANLLLFGVQAGGCVMVLDTLRWSLGPCARFGPEWIFAKGFGPNAADATATIGTAILGLDATARLTSRFGFRASFNAVVPFTRPDFYVVDPNEPPGPIVFRVPAVAARASSGAEFHF
jgi:hypothetical protein